ncbi:MAG TPA: TonB-dependent receptor [Holophagaceae bacterium]|nr:TonB-dependent receptor [Holophagaceae bacterium]
MHRRIAGLGRLLPILALGLPALAQGTQSANINGEVVDKAGNPIAGVRIILSSPALQGTREYRTDASGRFGARLLPPGEYKIVVSKEGLETRTLNQRVGLEQTFSPRIMLSATAGTVVEVVAANIAADKAEFKQAVNYTKETIDTLPVSRSNLLSITYLAPGVVENASSDRGGVSIRGSMGTGNLFLVDGQNVQDNLYQGQRIPIIFDSVEETQVLTGALPAEYGDVEGGVVNSITKSGGDDFTASLRFDMANQNWNAVNPAQDRAGIPNKIQTERSIQVDGPIIKSKLWFHLAHFYADPSTPMIGGAGNLAYPNGPANDPRPNGFPYFRKEDDTRREIKLTWAINQDHTLSWSYHDNDKLQKNMDYGAGDAANLVELATKGHFWNLQWKAIFGQNATLSAKVGHKDQFLGGGVTPDVNVFTLYNLDDGYGYRNVWFDPNDPSPDRRNNDTANVKFSYFLNALGHHQFDAGIDLYHGTTIASGAASPNYFTLGGTRYNNYGINVYGLDLDAGTASVDSIDGYQLMDDKAEVRSRGLYVNDRWELNKHWNFQIGFRFDSYKAESKLGGITSEYSGEDGLLLGAFSPRLGVKFDPSGDGKWTFALSYAKYNGRMLESTLQNVTYVNNPIYKEFAWSPGGSLYDETPVNFATMQQTNPMTGELLNYDPNYVLLTDAHFNVRVKRNLKPQQVAETQISATRSYESSLGNGFVRLNAVRKQWSNLIDYTQGNSGTVNDPVLGATYIRVYQNSDVPTREYKSVELEAQWSKGAFALSGNATWASLRGNFVGEAAASPGRGQGLEFFTVQNGYTMYDRNITNPSGRLPGDNPLKVNILGTYTLESFLGRTVFGLFARYSSGDVYSNTRSVRRDALTDYNPDPNYTISSQFGSRATQYRGNTRGDGRFPVRRDLDLSVQHDFKFPKFPNGRFVDAYLKLDVRNAFNHQSVIETNTAYESLDYGQHLSDPWVQDASFGQPTRYADARMIRLSFGIKY